MNDETGSFAAAKLRDYVQGEIKKNEDLLPHTGLVEPGTEASELLGFLETIYDSRNYDVPEEFGESRAGSVLRKIAATDRVGGSVQDMPSFAVGLTESEVDISESQAFAKVAGALLNENAPYSALVFGGMNKGKTGFAGLWLEIWKELVPLKYGEDAPEPVVLTNMRTLDAADYVVHGIEDLKRLAFGDDEFIDSGGDSGSPPEISDEVPKWWHFDECSTHLDARTKSWEVSNEYLPLVKRFAKVNMDAIHIGHSGMDIHADMRRSTITTEFIFKTGVKTANVFESMFEDQGSDLKYVLQEVPDTTVEYSPDDYSPFSWGN